MKDEEKLFERTGIFLSFVMHGCQHVRFSALLADGPKDTKSLNLLLKRIQQQVQELHINKIFCHRLDFR